MIFSSKFRKISFSLFFAVFLSISLASADEEDCLSAGNCNDVDVLFMMEYVSLIYVPGTYNYITLLNDVKEWVGFLYDKVPKDTIRMALIRCSNMEIMHKFTDGDFKAKIPQYIIDGEASGKTEYMLPNCTEKAIGLFKKEARSGATKVALFVSVCNLLFYDDAPSILQSYSYLTRKFHEIAAERLQKEENVSFYFICAQWINNTNMHAFNRSYWNMEFWLQQSGKFNSFNVNQSIIRHENGSDVLKRNLNHLLPKIPSVKTSPTRGEVDCPDCSSSTPVAQETTEKSSDMMVIFIVVGIVVLLLITAGIIIVCWRKRANKKVRPSIIDSAGQVDANIGSKDRGINAEVQSKRGKDASKKSSYMKSGKSLSVEKRFSFTGGKSVSKTLPIASGNKSVSKAKSISPVATDKKGSKMSPIAGNKSVAAGNKSVVAGKKSVVAGNKSVVAGNKSVGAKGSIVKGQTSKSTVGKVPKK